MNNEIINFYDNRSAGYGGEFWRGSGDKVNF